jgi:pimeloyl-ACP methyl ester carboxylesterase
MTLDRLSRAGQTPTSQRPALLLVHGFGDSSDTWSRLRAECARRGNYSAVLDLPGFRRTGPLRPGAVLPQLDEAVAAAARRLRQREGAVIVVGNSLGGTLGLRAGAAGEVDGVVALAPASVTLSPWLRRMTTSPVTARISRAPVPPQLVRATIGYGYSRLVAGAPGSTARRAGRRFSSGYDRRSASALSALGVRLLPELDEPLDVRAVACPVSLVWGELDRLVPARGARRLANDLPDGELVVLPGVGHCPQVEQPRQVADLVDALAARVARAPRTATPRTDSPGTDTPKTHA